MKVIVLLSLLVSSVVAQDGYAALNGGTTGGAGGTTTTVSAAAAFQTAIKSNTPKVVFLKGPISLSSQASIGNNTSIIGVGTTGIINGGGLRTVGTSNVIIRNLVINKVKGNDAITVQKAHNIWIDHNEFFSDTDHGFDFYDGQVDLTHACDFITVSWNFFHDHFKCSLIGHDPGNSKEDTGKFHITYHHNHWNNIHTRTPAMRFAHVHSFNNLFENVVSQGIHSRSFAQVLIEGNVFVNTTEPGESLFFTLNEIQRLTNLQCLRTGDFEPDGFANFGAASDFGTGKNNITATGNFTSVPYTYTLTPLTSVRSTVTSGAGVGKI
ncbi:polysaccharide lyase family 1 protein [Pleurotus ostreatus PC15]|uniref:Polysaccharide lyase family 1 protein n=1 Tax=Pleurotus ostreatus (strain PC15) TaxID=1137138 RepID=A0A067NLK5_PLEO1|nr:polysaccharide lyase family 1 protein [Pleurotus ostreatus PC15]